MMVARMPAPQYRVRRHERPAGAICSRVPHLPRPDGPVETC